MASSSSQPVQPPEPPDLGHTILVNSSHPLSDNMYSSSPVVIAKEKFYLPLTCFYSCVLAQNNMYHEAQRIIRLRQYRDNPQGPRAFALSVMASHRICERPEIILNRDEIWFAVLWEFFQSPSPGNVFRRFVEFFSPQFTDETSFVTPTHGTDRVFSSGFNEGLIRRAIEQGRDVFQVTPGGEVYGRVLRRIFKAAKDPNVARPLFTVEQLLNERQIRYAPYNRTIALISDSIFGYAESVEGGDIFYKGGLTCEGLAEALIQNNVHLNAYHVVIICVGTNDAANLSPGRWSESLEPLLSLLEPLVNDPGTIVIFNTGIGVQAWPHTPDYTRWFRLQFRKRILDNVHPDIDNFHLLDWSNPASRNHFMDEHRNPVPLYMEHGNHPNQHGLSRMRKRWIETYSPVGCVDMKFSRVKYSAGEMEL